MTVTVQINTDTATGQKLITELRRHPDVVLFVEPELIAQSIPEGYVSLKDGVEKIRKHVISMYENGYPTKK